MPSLYRFRSSEALVGERQELERQEIYFSSPEQLNDPLEGFKDLFWDGDEIVWRNLLKHYLLCLMHAYFVTKVAGQDYRLILVRDDPIVARLALPTPQVKDKYDRICARFFGSYGIDNLPALLAQCEYRFARDALEFVLRSVHQAALNAVLQIYGEDGLEPAANDILSASTASVKEAVSSVKRLLSEIAADKGNRSAAQLSEVVSVGNHISKQLDLISYLHLTDDHSRAWRPLFAPFSEQYIDQLRHFICFKWYAACFVADPNNAAMWSNYADSHKGVCLQFRAHDGTDGKPTLNLKSVLGGGSNAKETCPTYGEKTLAFEPVTYVDKFAPIDFFRSLARVTIPDLVSDWYSNEAGKRSPCGDGVLTDEKKWHQNIWIAFHTLTTAKLRYWEHEREYRLVLISTLDMFSEAADRKLQYHFADLEGIVFGINTPLSTKAEIIKVILAKCEREGRKEFKFSQAAYVPYSGKIETRPMDLLRTQ